MLRVLAAICVGGFLVLAACSGGGDAPAPGPTLSEEEQSYTATVAAVETIAAKPLPTPFTYDTEAIDLAIAAIRSGDPNAVLGQLRTTSIVCMLDVSGFRPPPSCEGVTEETLDNVFPLTNCDFRYVPRDEAERHIRLWLEAGIGPEVEGVYNVQRSSFAGRYRTHEQPQFAIVLRTIMTDRIAGWVLIYNQDGLIGFGTGCLRTPEEVREVWAFEGSVIPESQITPTLTPTPLPTPPLTDIAAIDAVIRAVLQRDGDALVAQMRMTRLACEAEPMGLSIFPFCVDEPDGTLVESFPISSCEGAYRRLEYSGPVVRGLVEAPFVEVFAVFETEGTRFDEPFYSYAKPTHVVVIQRLSGAYRSGSGVLVDEEGVVGQVGGCAGRPEGFIEFWELSNPVVAPPEEFLPTPTPEDIGIRSVDDVIDAILEDDLDALLDQVVYLDVACRVPTGTRTFAPDCEGAKEGTLIPTFPVFRCWGSYVAESEVEAALKFQGGILFSHELFAVYPAEGSDFFEGFFSATDPNYAVVLAKLYDDVGRGAVLLVNDDGFVAYGNSCNDPLSNLIRDFNLTDPIIPPPQER